MKHEMKDQVDQNHRIMSETLSNNFSTKDDAIEKHLYPLLQKDSLDYLSFKHAVENGTISGGLRLAIHKMIQSYADLYASSKQSRIEELEKALEYARDYLKKGGFGRHDCLNKVEQALNSKAKNLNPE